MATITGLLGQTIEVSLMSEMTMADGDDWVGAQGGTMACPATCCTDCCPSVVPVTVVEQTFDFGTATVLYEWSGYGDGTLSYPTGGSTFLHIFTLSVGGINQSDDVYSITATPGSIVFTGDAPAVTDLIVARGLIAAP